MNEAFVRSDGYFRSSSDTCDIFYSVWTPSSAPCAVVQIVHGARENISDYEKIAEFLVSKGFVVCIHDQLGHGKSVSENGGEIGFFASDDGDGSLIRDIENLRTIMRKKYRRLPYFLLGHRFGAFIAQAYAAAYPENTLDGLIISSPYKENLGILKFVSKLSLTLKGARHRAHLLHKLETGEKANEKALSVKAYRDLLELAGYTKDHLASRALPVFIVAGVSDRLGKGGKTAVKLYEKYFDAGVSDVSMKLYERSLLGASEKDEIFSDTAEWIKRVLDAKIELIRQNTFHF